MIPMISIVGHSNSGKTILLEKLIPELTRRGFRIGTVKHAPHGFGMDQQGKDGRRHLLAGAATTIVAGPEGLALFKKGAGTDMPLDRLQSFFPDVDLVICEGYKKDRKPKIVVIPDTGAPLPIDMEDNTVFAICSDTTLDTRLPVFRTDQAGPLADHIVAQFLSGHKVVSDR